MERALKEISVALLVKDIALAKTVSDSLREFGIFAHFYQKLEEFWVAINTHTPDLAIVDVESMNENNMLFRNHPKVKAKALRYAFAYSSQCRHLMPQTSGLLHCGLLNLEMELPMQLDLLLRTVHGQIQSAENNRVLDQRVKKLQQRSNRILSDAQVSQNFENQVHQMQDLLVRLGDVRSSESFVGRLADIFCEWDHCINYGIYELSQSGQQLVGVKLSRPKYKALPDLWISNTSKKGIDDYAQELAEEVCFDFFGKDLRVIRVCGASDCPDIMIIGGFEEENLNAFPWEMLETCLGSMYRQRLLNLREELDQSKIANIWDICSYLDDIHFHQVRTAHRVVFMNLKKLVDTVKQKHSNRFYWKAFHNDFSSQLSRLLQGNFKLSTNGVYEVLVMLDANHLEEDFKKLNSYVGEFPYWRYFADSSIIMSRDLAPSIKMLAPSSVNLLRNHYSDIADSLKEDQGRNLEL